MLKHLMNGCSYSALLLRSPPGEGGGGGAAADPPADADAGTGEAGDGAGAEGGEAGATAAGEGADADGGTGEGGEDEAPPVADWRSRELGRKHRTIQTQKTRIQELEEANEVLRLANEKAAPGAAAAAGDPPTRSAARRDDDADLETRAQQIAARNEFTRDCNTVAAAGSKNYGAKWAQAQSTLAELGGVDIRTMTGILATDDPSKVLYELGTNPDEFHRIMDLTPERRQTEMVKLAMKPAKKAPGRSKAPAPIEPVRSRSGGDSLALSDDLDDDTWAARRRAAKQAKWEKKQRRA